MFITIKLKDSSIKENKQLNDFSHTSYTSGSSASRHQSPLILRQSNSAPESSVSSFGEKISAELGKDSSISPGKKNKVRQETIGQILESQGKQTTNIICADLNSNKKKVRY
jgi:hypothetical protein